MVSAYGRHTNPRQSSCHCDEVKGLFTCSMSGHHIPRGLNIRTAELQRQDGFMLVLCSACITERLLFIRNKRTPTHTLFSCLWFHLWWICQDGGWHIISLHLYVSLSWCFICSSSHCIYLNNLLSMGSCDLTIAEFILFGCMLVFLLSIIQGFSCHSTQCLGKLSQRTNLHKYEYVRRFFKKKNLNKKPPKVVMYQAKKGWHYF